MKEREGWAEVQLIGIRTIKACNGCKWLKTQLIKSGRDPMYWDVCEKDGDTSRAKFNGIGNRLYKNGYGFVEPPGIDGGGCPFNQEIIRNNKLDNLIK